MGELKFERDDVEVLGAGVTEAEVGWGEVN
jgi:hypothetical protein